jgi:hypothetical protein
MCSVVERAITVVEGVISDKRVSKGPIRNHLERKIAQNLPDFAYSSSHTLELSCQFIRSKAKIGSHVEQWDYRLFHDREVKTSDNMVSLVKM